MPPIRARILCLEGICPVVAQWADLFPQGPGDAGLLATAQAKNAAKGRP